MEVDTYRAFSVIAMHDPAVESERFRQHLKTHIFAGH